MGKTVKTIGITVIDNKLITLFDDQIVAAEDGKT